MRTLRFYAAELACFIWAGLIALNVGGGSTLVAAIRLATLGIALGVSAREGARVDGERRRRRRRREG